MGLYEKLLEERDQEERRRGGPLPSRRGSGSKVIDRRLRNPPKDRPPGYAADLLMMHRLITEGPRSIGMGMRLGSLRAKYPKEYVELAAEARGDRGCRRSFVTARTRPRSGRLYTFPSPRRRQQQVRLLPACQK